MSWRTGKFLLGWDSSSWMLDFVAWTLTPGSMSHIAVLQWDCSTTRLTLLAKSLSAESHSVLATRTWGKEFWKKGLYIGKVRLKRARFRPQGYSPPCTHCVSWEAWTTGSQSHPQISRSGRQGHQKMDRHGRKDFCQMDHIHQSCR